MSNEDHYDILRKFYFARVGSIANMKIWDLPVLPSGTPILSALKVIGAHRRVWIVESTETYKLIGVTTEYDILKFLSGLYAHEHSLARADVLGYIKAETIDDIMTRHLVTITPEDYVIDALKKFKNYNIRYLPVVDEDKRLRGELSLHRVVLCFQKLLSRTI